MRNSILISLVSSLLIIGCKRGPEVKDRTENAFSDPTLRAIYQAADERDAVKLLTYFDHETAAYRMAAARCAASMTDGLFQDELAKLLKDPVPYVRLHAAFAVGQYRDSVWLPALERAIKKATIPEIKSEVLTAIGKCSNRQATEYLIFHEPNTAIEEAGKIWGVYYAMLRGNLQEKDLRVIAAHLKSQESETRLAAAHVLSRQNRFNLDTYKSDIISALESENRGEVRAVLTRCFKHFSGFDPKLVELAGKDADPRVRAEAIRAFSYPLSDLALKAVLQSLEDGSVWVAMSAAEALSKVDLPGQELSKIEFLIKTSPVPEVKSAIASTYMATGKPEKGWKYWNELSNNSIEKAILVDFMPNDPEVKDTLQAYALEDSPLGTACFRKLSLWNVNSNELSSWLKLANSAFSEGLIAQSYLASQAMLNISDLEEVDTIAVLDLYKRLTEEGQAETRNALRDLLLKLEADIPKIKLQGHKDVNWALINQIPKSAKAKIYTDKGEIELNLLIEDAPSSVSNFISLAEAGAYDSTFFHRVVPVFVSQGGGPRGDGFGSTKHTLRSEFSNLQFGPGVLGLASAGKDTESCQFFITHISTPHLNGRYTIMGATESGMGILDKISSGTRIDSVRYNS